jgi:hypothetical protein
MAVKLRYGITDEQKESDELYSKWIKSAFLYPPPSLSPWAGCFCFCWILSHRYCK